MMTDASKTRPTKFRTGGLSARKPTRFDHEAGAEERQALAPVRSVIDEAVRRRFVADLPEPEGDEVEMPEDDTVEPMPEVIDLAAVAAEALALALPLYPRAPGAELGPVVVAPDGVAPLTDADLKPFAGLAALAGKLPPKTDGKD